MHASVFLGTAALPHVARADEGNENAVRHARAKLEYVVPRDLSGCPDRDAFASSIATRLGYEATTNDDVPSTLRVVFQREGAAIRVHLHWVDTSKPAESDKSLVSETGACAELGAAAAFAAAILIDPRAMFPRPKDRVEKAPGESIESNSPGTWPWYEPRSPIPERTRPAQTPHESWRWQAMLAAASCIGCAPSANLGALVVVGVSKGSFGIDGGIRADLPASANSTAGRKVTSSLVLAELFPHGRFGPLRLGILGVGGTLAGESEGQAQASPYAGVGIRGAVHLSITRPVFVRLAMDGLVTLSRVSLRAAGSEVWTTPGVAAGLNLGAGVEF